MKKRILQLPVIITIGLQLSCANTRSENDDEDHRMDRHPAIIYNGATLSKPKKAALEENTDADWDQTLNDYEGDVDDYLVIYNKAMNGEATIGSEYPVIMERATALQQLLANAQNDGQLSIEQIDRMKKIKCKMNTAVTDKH